MCLTVIIFISKVMKPDIIRIPWICSVFVVLIQLTIFASLVLILCKRIIDFFIICWFRRFIYFLINLLTELHNCLYLFIIGFHFSDYFQTIDSWDNNLFCLNLLFSLLRYLIVIPIAVFVDFHSSFLIIESFVGQGILYYCFE